MSNTIMSNFFEKSLCRRFKVKVRVRVRVRVRVLTTGRFC